MDLNSDQQLAFQKFLNSKSNLFITGPAGTGKSRVLKAIVESLESRSIHHAVLAPTAVAASVIDGMTWHSFFGVGIMQGGLQQSLFRSLESDARRMEFQSLEVLILDEVSFIREEEIRLMNWILQTARGDKSEAFGGVRVIAFGDFTQLPPVPRFRGDEPQYAFQESRNHSFYTWEDVKFQTVTLKQNMRTDDRELSKLLEAVRGGRPLSSDQFMLLDSRKVSNSLIPPKTALRIYPTREMVEHYNRQILFELPGPSKSYDVRFQEGYVQDSELPLPKKITLKIGAQVMVRRNFYNLIPPGEILNGDLALVTDLKDASVVIKMVETSEVVEIPFCIFDILDKDYEVIARFTQVPVTLAYAVTVHKAQGQTIRYPVVINLSKTWLPGQVYVALSRVNHRDQLYIEGKYDDHHFSFIDARVKEFYSGKYEPSAEWKVKKRMRKSLQDTNNRRSGSQMETIRRRKKTQVG